jgi:hypothetical protein
LQITALQQVIKQVGIPQAGAADKIAAGENGQALFGDLGRDREIATGPSGGFGQACKFVPGFRSQPSGQL